MPTILPTVEQQHDLLAVMDLMHPEWREIVLSPQFEKWARRQGQAYHAHLRSTWNMTDMLAAICAFRGTVK